MPTKKPAMPIKMPMKGMTPGKPATPGKAYGQSLKGVGRTGKGKGKKGY